MTVDATEVVLAVDIDGSISFGGRPPGPAVRAALQRVRDTGRLVFATSRAPRSVGRILGSLADGVELVSCNGALTVDARGRVRTMPLPADLVDEMVAELSGRGAAFCLDYGGWFASSRPDALAWMGTAQRFALQEWTPRRGVVKLCVERADDWIDLLGRLAAGRAQLFPHERHGDLDVAPAGVTKASALAGLLDQGDEDRPWIIAVGNDVNDLDLLRDAGRAIVVGPGLGELDRLAHVTRVAPNDRAVACAIERAVATAQATVIHRLRAG